MKKTLVALAVAGLASTAIAAPEAGSVYFGAKAGWSNAHHGVNQSNTKYANNGRYGAGLGKYGINRNSVTYGAFGGYQIIDNLAVEVGYDYLGRVRGNSKNANNEDVRAFKHTAHGTTFSLKPSVELVSGLDFFGKVGLALVRNDYKFYDVNGVRETIKYHNFKPSLTLGGGFEFALSPSLAFNIEYQWLNRAGNYSKATKMIVNGVESRDNTKYSPDLHSVTAGLIFRFGQGQEALPVVEAEPELVTKNFAFNSDVLFDFGKASLKAAASSELDHAYAEIINLGLAESAVQVNGYTDRLGSDAYNMKLSQNRAETVANYIVGKGANPASVTAVGYGKASPVTGNTCDAVKGRQALIACLAPDRRVEVQVRGSKQIVM